MNKILFLICCLHVYAYGSDVSTPRSTSSNTPLLDADKHDDRDEYFSNLLHEQRAKAKEPRQLAPFVPNDPVARRLFKESDSQ